MRVIVQIVAGLFRRLLPHLSFPSLDVLLHRERVEVTSGEPHLLGERIRPVKERFFDGKRNPDHFESLSMRYTESITNPGPPAPWSDRPGAGHPPSRTRYARGSAASSRRRRWTMRAWARLTSVSV